MAPPSVRVIESAHNDAFKDLRRLLVAKGIRDQGRALVAGPRPVADALARRPGGCLGVVVTTRDDMDVPAIPAGATVYRLAPELFRELDVTGTDHPILLVSVPPFAPWDPSAPDEDGCTLLVPFQDPENVGAVIRTAAAFGVDRVVILAEGAHPFLPKAVRASSGAVLGVRLFEGPPVRSIPETCPVVPLSGEGRDIGAFRFPPRFALLPGLEGPGLPEIWRGRALGVPHRAEVESLNAAAATAIALYLWSRQKAAPPTGSRRGDRERGGAPPSAPNGRPRGTRGPRGGSPGSRRGGSGG